MKRVVFILVASIVLGSCIKHESPGPQGPRGPQGPSGIDGRNGRDGRDGRDGYGTYINTYYFDVMPSQWDVTDGDWGTQGYYCYVELKFGALTDEVIKNGAVLVYFIDVVGDKEFDNQLPYLIPRNEAGALFIRTIRYDLQPGVIAFIVEDSDFCVPKPPFGKTVKFKVVIISKV